MKEKQLFLLGLLRLCMLNLVKESSTTDMDVCKWLYRLKVLVLGDMGLLGRSAFSQLLFPPYQNP